MIEAESPEEHLAKFLKEFQDKWGYKLEITILKEEKSHGKED